MVPFLANLSLLTERVEDDTAYPFTIEAIRDLELSFRSPICFLVGENGCGKSTVLEAIADLCGLPVAGGSKADFNHVVGAEARSPLAPYLRPSFRKRPRDGYFFRAELLSEFARLLDEREADRQYFRADPYALYGGGSLQRRSHGEAFLDIVLNRFDSGLYLMDEPESALSPTRTLTLMSAIDRLARTGRCQFIIATHSPLLLTVPGAQIYDFDAAPPVLVEAEQTTHFRLTRQILQDPGGYWRSVRAKS